MTLARYLPGHHAFHARRHRQVMRESDATCARVNEPVFRHFDLMLAWMRQARPKYCTVIIVGMLSNELPQFAARMNAAHALSYGIQRSPTESWGEPTTGLLLARKD